MVWFSMTASEAKNHQRTLAELMPDFIIQDFNSQQFDVDGKLQYEMEATKLIHYPMNDVTELVLPLMKFKSTKKSSWTAQSQRGFVASEGNIVELKGEVVLTRQTAPEIGTQSLNQPITPNQVTFANQVTMETETLFIHLDKEFAETTKPVTISSTNSVVEAVGMQADFTKNRYTLVSNVRGRHDIPSKP